MIISKRGAEKFFREKCEVLRKHDERNHRRNHEPDFDVHGWAALSGIAITRPDKDFERAIRKNLPKEVNNLQTVTSVESAVIFPGWSAISLIVKYEEDDGVPDFYSGKLVNLVSVISRSLHSVLLPV